MWSEIVGRTKRKEQLDHIRKSHPEFWKWRGRFNKVVYSFGIAFVVFLVVGVVLRTVNRNNTVPSWYLPTFIAFLAIVFGLLPAYQLGIRKYKRDWKGGC